MYKCISQTEQFQLVANTLGLNAIHVDFTSFDFTKNVDIKWSTLVIELEKDFSFCEITDLIAKIINGNLIVCSTVSELDALIRILNPSKIDFKVFNPVLRYGKIARLDN